MTTPTIVTPAEAQTSGRRWLIAAGAVTALYLLLYYQARPVWDALHLIVVGSMWGCLAEWRWWRGYVKGWEANSRERERCG